MICITQKKLLIQNDPLDNIRLFTNTENPKQLFETYPLARFLYDRPSIEEFRVEMLEYIKQKSSQFTPRDLCAHLKILIKRFPTHIFFLKRFIEADKNNYDTKIFLLKNPGQDITTFVLLLRKQMIFKLPRKEEKKTDQQWFRLLILQPYNITVYEKFPPHSLKFWPFPLLEFYYANLDPLIRRIRACAIIALEMKRYLYYQKQLESTRIGHRIMNSTLKLTVQKAAQEINDCDIPDDFLWRFLVVIMQIKRY